LEEESVAFKMIPPQKIRAARRRGEDISLEWAIQWQQQNSNVEIEGLAEDQGNDRAVIDEVTEQLPPGFSRNYSFLTSRPEDVRVSDLPQLLSEYRMLVHATETLIGQRAAKASAERKKKTMAAQKDLLAVVKEVDPSLLPSRRRRSKFS
jgi:aminopeptidase N